MDSAGTQFHICDVAAMERLAGCTFGPFHREWLLHQAPEKVRDDLENAKRYPNYVMAKQGFMTTDTSDGNPSNFGTIGTTTTETQLWNPSIWGVIPALDMRPGKAYKVSFGGITASTVSPTVIWNARIGQSFAQPPTGATLGASITTTMGTYTDKPFFGECTMVVRSIGMAASGAAVVGSGVVIMPSSGTIAAPIAFGGATPITVDNTVAQGLGVTITFGASSAQNNLTCQWMICQSAN